MDILDQFGINPLLLAAQVVNFLILLFILNKLLYKPILKVLNERKKRIEDSLKNAEEIERRLQEIGEREAEALLKSAREGEKIIQQATIQASQMIEDGKKKAEQIIVRATKDAQEMVVLEKEQLIREVKDNLASFVALALQKVTGKLLTREDQKKMIEKTVRGLS